MVLHFGLMIVRVLRGADGCCHGDGSPKNAGPKVQSVDDYVSSARRRNARAGSRKRTAATRPVMPNIPAPMMSASTAPSAAGASALASEIVEPCTSACPVMRGVAKLATGNKIDRKALSALSQPNATAAEGAERPIASATTTVAPAAQRKASLGGGLSTAEYPLVAITLTSVPASAAATLPMTMLARSLNATPIAAPTPY